MTDQNISFRAISFREIPRTTRLFRDYVEDFGLVSRFYNPTGIGLEALVEHAGLVAREESPRADGRPRGRWPEWWRCCSSLSWPPLP